MQTIHAEDMARGAVVVYPESSRTVVVGGADLWDLIRHASFEYYTHRPASFGGGMWHLAMRGSLATMVRAYDDGRPVVANVQRGQVAWVGCQIA